MHQVELLELLDHCLLVRCEYLVTCWVSTSSFVRGDFLAIAVPIVLAMKVTPDLLPLLIQLCQIPLPSLPFSNLLLSLLLGLTSHQVIFAHQVFLPCFLFESDNTLVSRVTWTAARYEVIAMWISWHHGVLQILEVHAFVKGFDGGSYADRSGIWSDHWFLSLLGRKVM